MAEGFESGVREITVMVRKLVRIPKNRKYAI